MKIVFAPFCIQICLHRSDGQRLSQFFDLIKSLGAEISIECPNARLSESDLRECNLLISTTRQRRCPYNDDEIRLIVGYVQSGGALLVMSNHPPLTTQDSRLTEKLGFRFQDVCFKRLPDKKCLVISSTRPPAHGILSHPEVRNREMRIAVNNCSCIETDKEIGTPLLFIDLKNCIAPDHFNAATDPVFVIAIDRGENKALGNYGRIIGISDSGIIGKPTQQNPGPGLEPLDNYYFMQNVLKWLLGI